MKYRIIDVSILPMLSCYQLNSPDDKKTLFQSWSREACQWVVNDLDSKILLKEQLLKWSPGLQVSDQVLRASELWQKFLFAVDPQWVGVPKDLSQFLIEKWMGALSVEERAGRSPRDARKLFQTMSQLLPLLVHDAGEEMVLEWFAEKGEAKERWYPWYLLSCQIWNQFYQKKVLPEDWLKALLLEENFPVQDTSTFVFDLGFDMDHIESELILNLSRLFDVHVIVPQADETYEIYENLLAVGQNQSISGDIDSPQLVFHKLPTMLSEVKQAVGQVRIWLEEGCLPSEIALVSPVVENYWPTLSEHLFAEGIPCDKERATPLSQLPFFQKWLAKMRMAIRKEQQGDGETLFFSDPDRRALSFETFRRYFTQVYDIDDYQRLPEVGEGLPESIGLDQEMSLPDFMDWSSQWVDPGDWNQLVTLWQEFDSFATVDESLSLKQWVTFIEGYCARTERELVPAQKDGLRVVSITGAENLPLKKMIFLGLTEQNLRESIDTPLHWGDVQSIRHLFGFNLIHEDRCLTEKKLQWLSRKKGQDIHFFYGESDFSGQFQAPSVIWLQGALNTGHNLHTSSPQTTRWDQLQWAKEEASENQKSLSPWPSINRDLGRLPYESVDFWNLSLSASSIEEYLNCPFKFFARKQLNLETQPHLDLDIDNMSRGQILHRICELIIQEQLWLDQDLDLESWVERAKQDIDAPVYNEKVWLHLKKSYVQVARSFLEFEKKWRNEYPDTQTWGLEKSFIGFLSVEDGELKIQSQEKGIPFRGVIDRVDQGPEGGLLLLDYKSSASGLTQYSSWIRNNKIQMPLYALALNRGLVTGQAERVIGAYYFVLKDMERAKGFHSKEAVDTFLPKSRSAIDQEKILQLFEESEKIFVGVLQSLEKGLYGPDPKELKHCEKCDWKQICRHPPLNQ